jgi:copper chaperone CopZ
MEQLALIVPGMWADHHVIAVRGLLREVEGVEAVGASAMDSTVHLEYDPAKTQPDKIAAWLVQAGYAVGEAADADAPPTDKPAWASAGVRVTATDPADLAMSGDHRKY